MCEAYFQTDFRVLAPAVTFFCSTATDAIDCVGSSLKTRFQFL